MPLYIWSDAKIVKQKTTGCEERRDIVVCATTEDRARQGVKAHYPPEKIDGFILNKPAEKTGREAAFKAVIILVID